MTWRLWLAVSSLWVKCVRLAQGLLGDALHGLRSLCSGISRLVSEAADRLAGLVIYLIGRMEIKLKDRFETE